MARDPFRPQDPWSPEWQSFRSPPQKPGGVSRGVALLWVGVLLLLGVLYVALPAQQFGIAAVVLILVLLSTLRI